MTAVAADTVCEAFAALGARAQDCGYLVTVWPPHEPHERRVETDHDAACLQVFEPDPATHEADLTTLALMANAVAGIEQRARRG
jgi:hypothetical protein